jgi:hypothetical protein
MKEAYIKQQMEVKLGPNSFANNQSGIIEMDADPNNFNLMYASSWDKDRKAWNFRGSGEGSAIYKKAQMAQQPSTSSARMQNRLTLMQIRYMQCMTTNQEEMMVTLLKKSEMTLSKEQFNDFFLSFGAG